MSLLTSAAFRVIPGAFILNAGIGKLGMDESSSAGLQNMAATGIPQMKEIPTDKFGDFIAYSEIGIGATLLAPFVPDRLAGMVLTPFAAGLLSMYFGNPENTEDDGIRPSQEGLPLAKDSFLLAIGLGLALKGKDDKKTKKEKAIEAAEEKAQSVKKDVEKGAGKLCKNLNLKKLPFFN
ncbi:hypothetical protein [uncultured Corynebacterium sp.]|uniref:hypothetical protein n=1 Tax=uncultured Corynebacterium sp. TaxID=159447 RepID=UPI0026393552|nr:hypothetical protein [uncultured Corynebacterium sp.]